MTSNGKVADVPPPQDASEERVQAKLLRIDKCLVWTGGTNSAEYPKATINGKSVLVHRWVWERANGPIPKRDAQARSGDA